MRARLLGVLLVGLGGCQARLGTLRVEDTVTTTVEAGTLLETLVGDLGFGEWLDMDVTQAAELQNQGVEPGDITEVRLEAFTLTATAPEGADLAFLESMSLSVEAPDLDRAQVASASGFPEGQPSVTFDLDDVDLTPYALSQSMSLVTDVTGHRPGVDTEVTAAYTLAIGFTAQGVANQADADE